MYIECEPSIVTYEIRLWQIALTIVSPTAVCKKTKVVRNSLGHPADCTADRSKIESSGAIFRELDRLQQAPNVSAVSVEPHLTPSSVRVCGCLVM